VVGENVPLYHETGRTLDKEHERCFIEERNWMNVRETLYLIRGIVKVSFVVS
jgi:hypothetical protein